MESKEPIMRWPYIILVIMYCAGIFWLSSKPITIEEGIPHLDKVAHLGLYGVLAALVSLGMYRSGRAYSFRQQFHIPWIFAACYGISDEIHQYFVPLRTFDMLDLTANTIGALLAQVVLCYGWWYLSPRGRKATMQLRSSDEDIVT